MQVWNVLHVARWKYRTQKWRKNRHLGTIPQLCRAISSQMRHVSTIGKKLVNQQYLLHMFPQYGEHRPTSGWDRFGSLGRPSYFQRLPRLGAWLHGSRVVSVSQTLRRWTEGATYVYTTTVYGASRAGVNRLPLSTRVNFFRRYSAAATSLVRTCRRRLIVPTLKLSVKTRPSASSSSSSSSSDALPARKVHHISPVLRSVIYLLS